MIKILPIITGIIIIALMWFSLRIDRWEETMRDSEEEK
jgi:hypothetical protein